MSPEEVRAALEATLAWEGSFQVHITGGEPFLNFPLLLQAVEVAAELGIPRYVETNAGWCVRESLVSERLIALHQTGLQAILISCSPFHAETIPPQRTHLAIQKALEIFGSEGVIVYMPEWLEQVAHIGDEHATTPLSRYIEAYGPERSGRLFWEGYSLISGGRSAYRLGDLAHKRPVSSFRGANCRREILYAHHSHFDLYGNYISWFCGGLRVGDWHELPGLLSDYQAGRYPPLIATLVESGPHGLYEMACREYGYTLKEDGYVGKCHLCVDVRRHLATHGNFDELQPIQFYE